jgi:CTP:molybdopterin cytidylyltransferase MocA
MGAFKPLLPFGETTVLERSIALFRAAAIADIRVVVGHRADELLPLLARLQVRPLFNALYAEGMFSSVLAAAASLEAESEAFFLLPVDFPLIRPESVEMLLRAWRSGVGGILYPACRGRRGHPPLLATSYRETILAWPGHGGLRAFLQQYQEDAANIETGDEGILLDMDTVEDYARLRDALPK